MSPQPVQPIYARIALHSLVTCDLNPIRATYFVKSYLGASMRCGGLNYVTLCSSTKPDRARTLAVRAVGTAFYVKFGVSMINTIHG